MPLESVALAAQTDSRAGGWLTALGRWPQTGLELDLTFGDVTALDSHYDFAQLRPAEVRERVAGLVHDRLDRVLETDGRSALELDDAFTRSEHTRVRCRR